jgi:hypothetical protein
VAANAIVVIVVVIIVVADVTVTDVAVNDVIATVMLSLSLTPSPVRLNCAVINIVVVAAVTVAAAVAVVTADAGASHCISCVLSCSRVQVRLWLPNTSVILENQVDTGSRTRLAIDGLFWVLAGQPHHTTEGIV